MLAFADKLLVDKIWSSHNEAEMPDFVLPREATLVLLSSSNDDRDFRTTTIPITYDQSFDNAGILYSSIQTALDLFKATGNYHVNFNEIKDLNIEQIKGEQANIIPVSLLSSPKAYLILPIGKSIADVFTSYHISLGEIMQTCLLEVLEARYLPQFLYDIKTEKELISDFSAQVANWVCPCSYSIGTETPISYLDTHLAKMATFALQLSDKQEVNYFLPSHGNPVVGGQKKIHEDNGLRSRKIALKNRLEIFYVHLIKKWKALQDIFLLKEEVSQHLLPLNQIINKRPTKDGQLERNLHLKTAFIKKRPADFSIYVDKHGIWRVCFKKKEHIISTSNQGITIVEFLFNSPRQHFSTDELYDFLEERGKTYRTRDKSAYIDESKDRLMLSELKESYRSYRILWNDIKNKPRRDLRLKDLQVLKYFYGIVRSLLQFEYTADKRKLMQYIKNKIRETSFVLGVDPNFTDELASISKNKKSGNVKNRLDSFNKAIRTVVKDFQKHDEELSLFVDETILRRSEKSRAPQEQPFMYIPEYSSDSNLHSIHWVTSFNKKTKS